MSNSITREHFESTVVEWLMQKRSELSGIEITSDTDLIDSRIVDSLTFVEFLFFIEQLSGQSLSSHGDVLESFRSLDTIYNRFF